MADTSGERPELRVGNAERQAAMRALDTHVEAGRLSVEEYGDRSVAASIAVHSSDLAALFADLPAPHPTLPRRPGDEPEPDPDPTPTRSPGDVYTRPAQGSHVSQRESDAAVPVALGLLMVLMLGVPALMAFGAAAGGAAGGALLFLPLLFLLAGSAGRHHDRRRYDR